MYAPHVVSGTEWGRAIAELRAEQEEPFPWWRRHDEYELVVAS
jgi:hypothetical protein